MGRRRAFLVKIAWHVDQAVIKEIEHFFVSYNETHGKKFKPLGCKGPHVARRSVEDHTKRKEEGR